MPVAVYDKERGRPMKLLAAVIVLALGLVAYSGADVPAVVLEVEIGPELRDCPGGLVPGRKCMVMDGEPFYGSIEGFSYDEGYTWTLKVHRIEPWGEDGPPPEESVYVYYLLNVVSKEAE